MSQAFNQPNKLEFSQRLFSHVIKIEGKLDDMVKKSIEKYPPKKK